MKKLLELNIGEKLYFQNDSNPYIVRAKGGKFLIATTEDKGLVNLESEKFTIRTRNPHLFYTIVDTEKEICGPHDRTFNPYNFSKQEDIEQCLDDLIHKKYDIGLSKRHGASIYEAIDLVKTFMDVKIFKFDHGEGAEVVAADNAKAAIMHYFTKYQDDLNIDDICGTDGIKIEELHGEQITKKHKVFNESIGSSELISYRDLAVETYKGKPVILIAPNY